MRHNQGTIEELTRKSKIKFGELYDYTKSIYVDATTKMEFVCKVHGSFWQTPNNHLKCSGCPKCSVIEKMSSRRKRYSKAFSDRANKVHHDRYDYSLVDYVDMHSNIKIICKIHGEFDQLAHIHLRGSGCIKCAFININAAKEKTTEEFIQDSMLVHGLTYDYSDTIYTDSRTKVKIICREHGEFYQNASNHMNGRGCPECGVDRIKKALTYTSEEFIDLCRSVHGDTYDYSLCNYTSANNKVSIICKDHGIFEKWSHEHIQLRSGCPKCTKKDSLGEEIIKNWLDLNSIKYSQEKKFDSCKLTNIPMRFDFFLPELNLLIEYDGQQHFYAVDYWGGDDGFEKIQYRDAYKTKWAEENNFGLIRIPYTERRNIDQILSSHLLPLNSTEIGV